MVTYNISIITQHQIRLEDNTDIDDVLEDMEYLDTNNEGVDKLVEALENRRIKWGEDYGVSDAMGTEVEVED